MSKTAKPSANCGPKGASGDDGRCGSSPLNYLIQIGCETLLPQIYERIIVPSGVMKELGNAAAPPAVHAWLGRIPVWIEQVSDLGLGEREAIQIAEEQHADLLLIDERKGRLEEERSVSC